MLLKEGIEYVYNFTDGVGQSANNQWAINNCTTQYILRLDDDVIFNERLIENLFKNMIVGVGAIGPRVITPGVCIPFEHTSGKISDIYNLAGIQLAQDGNGLHSVEHLHCSFLFDRTTGVKTMQGLSPVGFREDSILSHNLYRQGLALLVDLDCEIYHHKSPSGGSRTLTNQEYQDAIKHDEELFAAYLNLPTERFFYLDNGIGDHWSFKHILKDVPTPYTIACCYPDVFFDIEGIKLVSLAQAQNTLRAMGKTADDFNIYKYMYDRNHQGNLVTAFRELYNVPDDVPGIGGQTFRVNFEKRIHEANRTNIISKDSDSCFGSKEIAAAFDLNTIEVKPKRQNFEYSLPRNTPLVSVIVPMHNAAKTIEKTLKSILNQTYSNIEVIVVDDCSEDTGPLRVESLMRYGRIHFHKLPENSGSPATPRNYAILNSIGDYIAFCDADDIWEQDHLEKCIKVLEEGGVGMVYTDCKFANEQGEEQFPYGMTFPKKFDRKQLEKGNYIHISSVVVTDFVMNQTGSFDTSLTNLEDWDMWLRISEDFNVAYIPEKTITYLVKPATYYTVKSSEAFKPIVIDKHNLNPKISIIIGTLNHLEDCLKPCIESLIKYTDFDNTELIVVANGCTDGTLEYLEQYPFIKKLVYDKPLGFSAAYNEGIREASGDYIVLLNNDTQLLPQPKNQWLDLLIAPLNDTVGLSGPLMGYNARIREHFLIFFCVMITRDVFDKVGLLDEAFKEGSGEDTSYCLEAKKAGFEYVQVPTPHLTAEKDFMVGNFPIYHKAEGTVHDLVDWKDILKRNDEILDSRYAKSLTQIYENYQGTQGYGDKGTIHNYIKNYEKELEPYRFLPITLLEIGVFHGHSLRMWREYFPNARIIGIDMMQPTLPMDGIEFYICDQNNPMQLASIFFDTKFDVIIDDGSHIIEHQIKSIQTLFKNVNEGGKYIIEDIQNLESDMERFKTEFIAPDTVYDTRKDNNRHDDVLLIWNK